MFASLSCFPNVARTGFPDNRASLSEGAGRTVTWLEAHGKIENSDNDPYEDRVIAAWERHQERMAQDLHNLDGSSF